MTDDPTTTPQLPPEELASAYVDGELSAAEREAVEADTALMALVGDHRQVRAAVGSPTVALTDAERDDLVAAALAALAEGGGEGSVTSLASHRQRRSRRWLGAAAGAAAAAVVALALVVSRPGDGGDDTATDRDAGAQAAMEATAGGDDTPSVDDTVASDTEAGAGQSATTAAAAAAPAAETSQAPAAEAPAEDRAVDEASAAAALAALEDLGPLANRPAFIEAARRFASTVPPAGGTSPCPDYPPPLATATFRGTPAYLVVIEANPAGNRLALVDSRSCASLVKVDLASQ